MLGETIFGLDIKNHLWVILSRESDGQFAAANLVTHGRMPHCLRGDCAVIQPGEHPFVTRETCIFFRKADFIPAAPLVASRERGTLEQSQPFSPELLRRVQEAALVSRLVTPAIKDAIRASM